MYLLYSQAPFRVVYAQTLAEWQGLAGNYRPPNGDVAYNFNNCMNRIWHN